MTHLHLVDGVDQIERNINYFNNIPESHIDLAYELLRTGSNWVYSPLTEKFAIGKFAGYADMTYDRYNEARDDSSSGDPFDGGAARSAIEKATGVRFERYDRDQFIGKFITWAESLLGVGALDGVDQTKWRFLELPKSVQACPLIRFEDYTRQEVHDIFAPDTPFYPQRGTWGLHGIVPIPDRLGDFVFFVTFGQSQGDHEFDEFITEDGILAWQSQLVSRSQILKSSNSLPMMT